MDKLLEVLRDKKYEKKPTVDELKSQGIEVSADDRNKAWATYQKELEVSKAANDTPANDDNQASLVSGAQAKDDAAGQAAKSEAQQKPTTDTTSTTENVKPTHRVTVKKDGFRRSGRAWTGTTDVTLSDDELDKLKADPMFSVIAL